MATDLLSPVVQPVLPTDAYPDVEHLVTEDDTPVENVFSEKQQRLLTEPLFSSWTGPEAGRPFVAMANVGLFYAVNRPPFVPDVLLSLDAELPADVHVKAHRSYFTWLYGKAPDVVIEVVSNREGGEDTDKLTGYARVGVRYYVIFDPEMWLSRDVLRVYGLSAQGYREFAGPTWFPDIGLGLAIWQGRYEDDDNTWLRWVNAERQPIATGQERAAQALERAELEKQRAELEKQRADELQVRLERLAEQIRQLGGSPEA